MPARGELTIRYKIRQYRRSNRNELRGTLFPLNCCRKLLFESVTNSQRIFQKTARVNLYTGKRKFRRGNGRGIKSALQLFQLRQRPTVTGQTTKLFISIFYFWEKKKYKRKTYEGVQVGFGSVCGAVIEAGIAGGLATSEIVSVSAAAQQVSVKFVRVAEDLGRHDRSVTAQRLCAWRKKKTENARSY